MTRQTATLQNEINMERECVCERDTKRENEQLGFESRTHLELDCTRFIFVEDVEDVICKLRGIAKREELAIDLLEFCVKRKPISIFDTRFLISSSKKGL